MSITVNRGPQLTLGPSHCAVHSGVLTNGSRVAGESRCLAALGFPSSSPPSLEPLAATGPLPVSADLLLPDCRVAGSIQDLLLLALLSCIGFTWLPPSLQSDDPAPSVLPCSPGPLAALRTRNVQEPRPLHAAESRTPVRPEGKAGSLQVPRFSATH